MTNIQQQYSTQNLLERIFGGLVMAGKDPFSLSVNDLAAVDEFHTRGRKSTEELAELALPKSTDRVLDVGCGLGGSARFLAWKYRCRVTGIDLTPEYIKVATRLTELVKMSDRVDFAHADALNLSFRNESMDLVWTEHAQMNIESKRDFYFELARVLKPGGRFVFHDVFATPDGPVPLFPLPWADESSISFLVTLDEAKEQMVAAGLRIECVETRDAESESAFNAAIQKLESDDLPPLGLHLLMGPNANEKMANYLRCLQQSAVTVAMGLATRKA